MNSPVPRQIGFVLLGVAGLLLKPRYSGPLADAVHRYARNLSVSFAVYFIFASSRLGRRFGKAATTVAALLVVQFFEATNGFGVMANVFDPLDFVANLAGVSLALAIDVAAGRRTEHSAGPAPPPTHCATSAHKPISDRPLR